MITVNGEIQGKCRRVVGQKSLFNKSLFNETSREKKPAILQTEPMLSIQSISKLNNTPVRRENESGKLANILKSVINYVYRICLKCQNMLYVHSSFRIVFSCHSYSLFPFSLCGSSL